MKSIELILKHGNVWKELGTGIRKFGRECNHELDTYLQNEPEITVHSNHHFTYKNSASTTATNIFFYSVDRNKVIPRFETESTVQSISEPGHYILEYLSEFETGKVASYFVKINVVK